MIAFWLAVAATPLPADSVVEEHLGRSVPLSLALRDTAGHVVQLRDYVRGDKPVLLILAYFSCPMLCGLVLRGAADAMQQLSLELGRDYRAVTVSFDPQDTPEMAHARQAQLVSALGVEPSRWPFLVGNHRVLDELAPALGFTARRDEATQQYAHPAVVFVLTPEGRVSRYLYGLTPSPRDLSLALIEAARGRVGSTFERILMRCYSYNPATRRYAFTVASITRIGGFACLVALTGLLTALWRRERRARRR